MKELNKKGEKFYNQWAERRNKKWRYVFVQGIVYFGLPVAIISFLINCKFNIENMHLSEFLRSLFVFGIGGILFGLRQFKRTDNLFLSLNDEDEIVKGVKALKAGDAWSYENLKIHRENDESIIVQNDLFWFEEKGLTHEKLNECYNLIHEDIVRLKKSKDFDEYLKYKDLKIRILGNSGSNVPLFETSFKRMVSDISPEKTSSGLG